MQKLLNTFVGTVYLQSLYKSVSLIPLDGKERHPCFG